MAAYLVSCDFAGAGAPGQRLCQRLAGLGDARQLGAAMWLVITQEDALGVQDALGGCLDAEDKLFVARLQGDVTLSGYSAVTQDWVSTTLLCESDDGENSPVSLRGPGPAAHPVSFPRRPQARGGRVRTTPTLRH